MTEAIPQIVAGLDDDGRRVVLVGEAGDEVADLAGLRGTAGLMQPDGAVALARAVNHLAQGGDFQVITDPAAFETAYRARLSAEDLSGPWRQGIYRLGDYGVPDFSVIRAPALEGHVLVFFAEHAQLGVPYRVEVDLGAAVPTMDDDSYRVVPLTPLDEPNMDEQPGEPSDEIKALQAQLAASGDDT